MHQITHSYGILHSDLSLFQKKIQHFLNLDFYPSCTEKDSHQSYFPSTTYQLSAFGYDLRWGMCISVFKREKIYNDYLIY